MNRGAAPHAAASVAGSRQGSASVRQEDAGGELIAEDDAQYTHWRFISEQLKSSRCYSITPGFRYTPGVDNGNPEAYIVTVSWI